MNIIDDILEKLEVNGFKAYVVGGYVRDTLINKKTNDIDIITDAREKELMWIFKNSEQVKEYGTIKLHIKNYDISIATLRKEENVLNGKPSKITYINSLEEDLKRRDFTINALCFDSKYNLIDLVNGRVDLDNKIIRVIGNTKNKFDEDPLRILRALRFMTILDFNLSQDIIDYLKNYGFKLSEINYDKKKKELDKIFASKNIYKFIMVLKRYNLEEYLGIKINKVIKCGYSIGIWSQIEFSSEYKFSKIELSQIEQIRRIVKNKNIDKYVIYKNGNYISTVSGVILGKQAKKINNIYMNLPIKDKKDIDITSKEICDILNIKPSKELGIIYKELEKMIVYGKIENRKEVIVNFLRKKVLNERFKGISKN